MPKSEASISINAPIEKIFNAVADPKELTQYAPAGVATDVVGNPDELGSYANYDYHLAGMTFHARATVLEVDKPNKIVHELSGAMPGKWTWSLEQDDQAIRVKFSVNYGLPWGILGTIANALLLGRMNQKNAEKTVKRLKVYCEI